jgi:small subunit ribosomal protein S33
MSLAAFIPPSRLSSLTKLRCAIFQTSYNPSSIRTGAKYLKRRLRGPSLISYYPEQFDINKIVKAHPELEMVDEEEEERLADVADRRKRGKGAPRKAKSKGRCWLWVSSFITDLFSQLTVGGCIRNDDRRSLLYQLFSSCSLSQFLYTLNGEFIVDFGPDSRWNNSE